MIDYEAASRTIQGIVSGACRDPKVRRKASSSATPATSFDTVRGGHWASRVINAALGNEPLYRLDNSEPKKTYSEDTIGAFIHTTLGYVRTGVLVRVWPKEDNDE